MNGRTYSRQMGPHLAIFDYPNDRFLLFLNASRADELSVRPPRVADWIPVEGVELPAGYVSLIISPTARCMCRCRYCLADHYDNGDTPLDASAFGHLAKKAHEAGILRFDFSGGEPLMRSDIEPIIEAVTPWVGVIVTTSGVEHVLDTLARVARLVPIVQVSLDGHLDSMNAPRGTPVAAVRRSLDCSMQAGAKVRIVTVAHRFNWRLLPSFGDALAAWGVWEWKVLRVAPLGAARDWEGCLTDAEAAQIPGMLARSSIPTQVVGCGPSCPRVCLVVEDDLHLHVDRSGYEEDLGRLDMSNPFAGLRCDTEDPAVHFNYYMNGHSRGVVYRCGSGGNAR